MRYVYIFLTEEELILADKITDATIEKVKRKKYQNRKVDEKRSDIDIIKQGICGQIAFAKWLGLSYKFGQFQEPDIIDKRGYGNEIKTTHYPKGRLLVSGHLLEKNSDLFWCIIKEERNKFKIVGFAFRNEIIKEENRNPFLKNGFTLEQDKLHTIEEYHQLDQKKLF